MSRHDALGQSELQLRRGYAGLGQHFLHALYEARIELLR